MPYRLAKEFRVLRENLARFCTYLISKKFIEIFELLEKYPFVFHEVLKISKGIPGGKFWQTAMRYMGLWAAKPVASILRRHGDI